MIIYKYSKYKYSILHAMYNNILIITSISSILNEM